MQVRLVLVQPVAIDSFDVLLEGISDPGPRWHLEGISEERPALSPEVGGDPPCDPSTSAVVRLRQSMEARAASRGSSCDGAQSAAGSGVRSSVDALVEAALLESADWTPYFVSEGGQKARTGCGRVVGGIRGGARCQAGRPAPRPRRGTELRALRLGGAV